MNGRARRALLALPVVAAACASTAADRSVPIRVGLGIGRNFVAGHLDGTGPATDVDLEDADVTAGFGEIVLDTEIAVHARGLWSESTMRVENTAGDAEVTQVLALVMLAKEIPLFDGVALRPMFGGGVGYTELDLPPMTARDASGSTIAFAGALELEFARHATLGAMLWATSLGEPGDTEAQFDNLLLYAGVRF